MWECVPFCLSFPFWPAKLQERFPCHDSSPLTLLLVALRVRLCSPPRSFICVWWLWEKSAVPLPSGRRDENHSALSEMTGDFPKMRTSSGSHTAAFAHVLIFVSCRLCSIVWDVHRTVEIWCDYLPRLFSTPPRLYFFFSFSPVPCWWILIRIWLGHGPVSIKE